MKHEFKLYSHLVDANMQLIVGLPPRLKNIYFLAGKERKGGKSPDLSLALTGPEPKSGDNL